MSEEEVVVVGVDIGTSNCVIAGIKDDNAFVIDIGLDNKTAPANCLIDEADDCVISTRNMSNSRKGDTIIQHFKPFMGRTHPADGSLMQDIERWGWPCEIDDQGFPIYRVHGDNVRPEQPYALLIKYLVKMYQKQTYKTPTDFVLAVPAYWPAPRRQAALDAAKIAGIKSKSKIVSEPVAAVIGYTKKHPDIKGENIVCIDIGGGTTDVASLYVNEERTLFVVNATAGNNDLGGEHCTMALVDVCKGKMKGVDVSEHKLRHACEMAKTSGRYPMEIELNDETRIKVTRSEYKNACQEFLKKLGDVIDKVFKKNEDVKVIVVGGAFRDEVILEYCKNKIGRDKFIPPYSLSTPVAEGAAWIGQPNSGIVVE
ncbi:Heat shock 70 kDa protein [Fusarium oxysporum f. sp. rapae]|uniref:Heat shock 70 kDa protein n=1 Tax=Fusarium oxysporum f. sp. rapae TaxID=485398 RepID=A0A8J5TWY9_FUSOX|nr:Heat shock 70 kDa protein [Fusarium oxysporum f. sp. rapae]